MSIMTDMDLEGFAEEAPKKRKEAEYGEYIASFEGYYVGETKSGKPSINLRWVVKEGDQADCICWDAVYYGTSGGRYHAAKKLACIMGAPDDKGVEDFIQKTLEKDQHDIITFMRGVKDEADKLEYKVSYKEDGNFKRLEVLEVFAL